MTFRKTATGLCLTAASALLTGCATVFPQPTDAQLKPEHQFESAGYTGCQPQDNVISQFTRTDMGTTWQATCKGKTYLCTASYASRCAPLAQ